MFDFIKKDEFDADLEDHVVPNNKYFRLHYVDYMRDINGKVHMTNWTCNPFLIPDGLDKYSAFKILSYLVDYIERNRNLENAGLTSMVILDDVLDLERLGFKRTNNILFSDEITSLFTVAGRVKLFKNSPLYNEYFEWYVPNVSFDEVKDIYASINIDFYDLVLNKDNVPNAKVLKLNK